MNDPISKPTAGQPDASRRRFAKAGLAAPVVLATLASKPVLGAVPWKCTISGKVSGNMSGHESEVCSNLGSSPGTWAGNAGGWPNCGYFFSTCPVTSPVTQALLFKQTPASAGLPKFADVFWNNTGTVDATVWDVIIGSVTSKNAYATATLGMEAVAALLNAMQFGTAYPVPSGDVVNIFNSAATTGSYTTEFGEVWSVADVVTYFQSLHP
jgi:hypothetical protein